MLLRRLLPMLLFAAIVTSCSDAAVRQIGVTKKRYHSKNVPNARSGQKYKIRY